MTPIFSMHLASIPPRNQAENRDFPRIWFLFFLYVICSLQKVFHKLLKAIYQIDCFKNRRHVFINSIPT